MEERFDVYFDGAAYNRLKCAWAFIVKKGNIWVHSDYGVVPVPNDQATCNVAEHYALMKALQWLLEQGHTCKKIVVHGDSKMTISQVFRGWKFRNPKLPYVPWMKINLMLRDNFSEISGKLIPRSMNDQCDELSKMGMRTELA